MTGRKKAHFVTVVWGEAFTRHFLDVVVPTNLSENNIPAFAASHDGVYCVYCPAEDAARIRSHPVYAALCAAITVELRLIDDIDLTDNKYHVMTACHRRAVERANAEDAALIFLAPDAIFADGCFKTLARLYSEGKRLVVQTGIRLREEPFRSDLDRAYFQGRPLRVAIPPRELLKVALNSLHPMAQSYFVDSDAFSIFPSNVYWRQGEEGLIGHNFHMHPLLVHPRQKDLMPKGTIDNDFILSCASDEELYVVTDSDESMHVDSCPAERRDGVPLRNRCDAVDVAYWAKDNANRLHRAFFTRAIKWHTTDLTEQWRKTEAASERFSRRVLGMCDELAYERGEVSTRPSLRVSARDRLALRARQAALSLAGDKRRLKELLKSTQAWSIVKPLMPKNLVPAAKKRLKQSPLAAVLKFLLPKHHRPYLRLVLAKLAARVDRRAGPGRLAQARVEVAKNQLYRDVDPQTAIATCLTAIAADPRCGQAYFQLGRALVRQGRSAEGLQNYETALALETGQARAEIHGAIAAALVSDGFEDPAKFESAIGHYRSAIALDPQNITYRMNAGGAFHVVGRFAEAERAWHEALALRRRTAKERGLEVLGLRFLADSWFMAIGHMTVLDIYVKMGVLGLRPSTKIVLARDSSLRVPNECLLNYWKPYLEVISEPEALGVSRENAELLKDEFWAFTFPGGRTLWYAAAAAEVQRRWEAQKRAPLLSLTESDQRWGQDRLRELGIPEGAWFVCLHVREAGFHRQWNLAHSATRDAQIESYDQAVRVVTSRGGWVVRLGDPSMKPLPPKERVIDYARSALKSDRMDVFLAASCRFFIGTNSGMALVPSLFGRPCALTNYAPMGTLLWYGDNVWIPKLYRRAEDGRLLTFEELFGAAHHVRQFQKHFESHGISVVDNTPEEIAGLVLELLERTAGAKEYSTEDEELQEEFRRLASRHGGYTAGRIGRDFLREHRRLLAAAPAVEGRPA